MNGTGDSLYANAIYHKGQCLTKEADFSSIRNNLTYFYACKLNENETGVFVGEKECADQSRAGEITQLFDIPNSIRKTGTSSLSRIIM